MAEMEKMVHSTRKKQDPESGIQNPLASTQKPSPRELLSLDLDFMDYRKALDLQLHLVNARHDRILETDAVMIESWKRTLSCSWNIPLFSLWGTGVG